LSQAELKAREMLNKHGAELEATAEGELKELDKQIASACQGAHRALPRSRPARNELKTMADRMAVEAVLNPHYVETRRAAEHARAGRRGEPDQDGASRNRPRTEGQALPRRPAVHVPVGARFRDQELPATIT
jgi:hypothetical protein